jgi:nucleotide-binding universal stress UspA family protein
MRVMSSFSIGMGTPGDSSIAPERSVSRGARADTKSSRIVRRGARHPARALARGAHDEPKEGPMKFGKILVAIDFSPHSEHAIDAALALADPEQGTLTLFHVCELPAYSTPELSIYVPSPELAEDLTEEAKRSLERYRAQCAEKGVRVEVACLLGTSVAGEIVEYAAAQRFDLIVVGTHGRHGLRRLVLGSVAERVVRTADRPVLTVRTAMKNSPTVEDQATAR